MSLQKHSLKFTTAMGFAAALALLPVSARAQVAGSQPLALTVEETRLVALGWSARNNMLGKAVYNDRNERIGTIDDVIISPDQKISFAIIGVGGFLGLGKHDVAMPMDHLKIDGDRIVLPGATREALKALPEFEYAKNQRTASSASTSSGNTDRNNTRTEKSKNSTR